MNTSNLEPALRELAAAQADTAAALRALTHEVRVGFDKGSARLEKHGERLANIEHREARRHGYVAAIATVAGLLGIDRIISLFQGQ